MPSLALSRSPGMTGMVSGTTPSRVPRRAQRPRNFCTSPNRLHDAGDGPVGVDADLPDALEVHPARIGQPAAPVPILGPGDGVEAAVALEPGVARRLSGLHAAK